MSKITRQDTNGVKPLLATGELGYDNYPAGGDAGRVYVGTGSVNIAQAKKSEVDAAVVTTNAHIARVNNPHNVTKTQVGLGNVDNTSDANKPVSTATQSSLNLKANDNAVVKLTGNETIAGVKTFSSTIVGNITGNSATATKLATARTIGGVSFDGTANINLPGVNADGNQNTTGNAGSATKLATARTINEVAFDGSANITVSDATAVKLTEDQTITGTKTFKGLSKTSIGDNALEVITSNSNGAAGSFMVSQGGKYGLALNGIGTVLETGRFAFQVINRDSKTVQSMPFNIGINGVVSYASFPVTPSLAPTADYQVANKKYVDDNTLLSPNDNRVKTALNASGTAPIYACRAWVNFNGTGTVAIRASGNVSSITDNGVGRYTVNFTKAMPDANYSATGTISLIDCGSTVDLYTTSSVRIISFLSDIDTYTDPEYVSVSIFG